MNPGKVIRKYPADEEAAQSRERLHHLLAEAREQREDPVARAHRADTQSSELRPVPGSSVAQQQKRREAPRGPQRANPQEVRAIVEKAITNGFGIEMIYHSAKDDSRKQLIVLPEKVALNREGAAVLVAIDTESGNRLSYAILQIERARTTEKRLGEGS